jgi:surfeit locus 1 family protein
VNPDARGRGGLDDDNRYDDHTRWPRSGMALAVIGFFALLGIVVFTSLGVWQIERRAWKLDLIERVEARVHATPMAAPGPQEWPAIDAKDDEYRHVIVSGHFLNDRETLVTAVTDRGAGFWVLTPLVTKDRSTILINRGFVPSDRRDPSSRAAGALDGETTVTGLLRITEPKGGFLRANDASADRWFSRDVDAIAAKRGLENPAPYFIDADATSNPGGFPIGGLTVVAFHNNHLVYALTWFALALMLAAASIRVVREEIRIRRMSAASGEPGAKLDGSWSPSERHRT